MFFIVVGVLGLVGLAAGLIVGFYASVPGGFIVGGISVVLGAVGLIGFGRAQRQERRAYARRLEDERSEREVKRRTRLKELWAESLARCAHRWQAVEVARDDAYQLAEDLDLGRPASDLVPTERKPVVLLVGEIGAGKSLAAERHLQLAVRRALHVADSPIPVYLRAQAVGSTLREGILDASRDIGDPRTLGAVVVVDGADEAGLGPAAQLLEEARVLSGSWTHTTVLITSRPIPSLMGVEETMPMPELEEERAHGLIGWVASRDINEASTWRWPDSVKRAVRRPLFALLMGTFLRDQPAEAPRSSGELLAHLVERALSRGPSTNLEATNILKTLGVLSIDRGGSPVPKGELGTPDNLQSLLGTGLVVQQNGLIGFSLPILAEWFAAQGLATGMVDSNALIADPVRLEHWFSPLVILAGNFDHDRVSPWLSALARRAPAFASMVVQEGLARWGLAGDVAPPPALECGRRIREATEAWVEGSADLAQLIAPLANGGKLRSLGVRTHEAGLYTSWYVGKEDLDLVVPLEESGLNALVERGWGGLRFARPGRQPAWAWRWSLDELSHRLQRLLEARALPTDAEPFVTEAAWLATLALTRRGSLASGPVARREIEEALARLPADATRISHYARSRSLTELRIRLREWQERGFEEVHSPWPPPDKAGPWSGWIWEPYSEERLKERAHAVLRAALGGYRELVSQWFPRLARRFDTAATLPARLDALMLRTAEKATSLGPSMVWFLDPLPPGSDDEVVITIQE